MGSFRVGVQLQPQHTTMADLRAAWEAADAMGVDSIWTWDHFYPLYGDGDGTHFEGWSILAAMAATTTNARFGVMEPKRGLFAGGGTTVRLPRQLAFPAAMEFLLTAEAFPAERALDLGLLNEIVGEDELLDKARDWAARINANGPLAVRATKESVLRGLATDMREAYKIESELGSVVFGSEDAKEGPKAFAEKRPPNWQGK